MDAGKTLYVLHINHKYGDNYWVYDNAFSARQRVVNWCKEWWDTEISSQPMPNDDDVIFEYFDNVPDEFYVIEKAILNAD